MSTIDRTRLKYWFPLIQSAGLPVPATEIIQISDGDNAALQRLMDGGADAANVTAMHSLADRIREAATKIVGTAAPFFLRTDYTSGKHDWERTCYVSDRAAVTKHICGLVEFSMLADFMGLPTDVWVVRELLETTPMFRAFRGMPIVREFRLFTEKGELRSWQPYWPATAIEEHRPSVSNWRELLDAASTPTRSEMSRLITLAHRANAVAPGYWSMDFLETAGGEWFLTDMAEGDRSYKWEHDFAIAREEAAEKAEASK